MLHTFDTSQKFAERRAQREKMILEMERRASLNPDEDTVLVQNTTNSLQGCGFPGSSTARDILEDDPPTGVSTRPPTAPVRGFREYNAAMWTSIRGSVDGMSFRNKPPSPWAQKSMKDINLQEGVRSLDKEIQQDEDSGLFVFSNISLPRAFCQTREKYDQNNKRRRNVLLICMACGIAAIAAILSVVIVSASSGGGSSEGSQVDVEVPGDIDVPSGGEVEKLPEILHRTSSILVHYGLLDLVDLDDIKTPQRQTIQWLSESALAEQVAEHHNPEDWTDDAVLRPFVELYGLGVIYRSLGGAAWETSTNYNMPPTSACDLYGIKCVTEKSSDGEDMEVVSHIVLKDNLLEGALPKEVGLFLSAVDLDLSDNLLDGDIPEAIGQLRRLLKLNLSRNMLESIPRTIHSLIELRYLHLEGNQLQGTMPQLKQFVQLETVTLNDNFLAGDISEMVFPSTLKHLFVQTNQLSGNLPGSLGYAKNLEEVHLRNNLFEGSLPHHWSNLEKIKVLDVSENDLTGLIPVALLEIPGLEELRLYDNKLEGRIPEFEGAEYSMKVFDVESNSLTGQVPWSLMQLTALEIVKMGNNAFTGMIPDTLGSCTKLKELSLAINDLTGAVPAELGALTDMIILRLEENELTGEIPSSLPDDMGNLIDFRIQRNNIEGTIPDGFCDIEVLVADCKEEVSCACCTECY